MNGEYQYQWQRSGLVFANKRVRSKGFTLTEVLVALAITSLASLALFQSMGMWITLSAKASQSTERALGNLLQEAQFRTIVSGLTPGWPTIEKEIFIGKANFFSGLTSHQLHLESPVLDVVTVEIKRQEGNTQLNYLAFGTAWTMETYQDAVAGFDYLGADGNWYLEWPPAENPEPGPFSDASVYDTPQLPEAIRLTVENASGTKITIARVESDPELPLKEGDLFGSLPGL